MNSIQNKELSPGITLSHYRIVSKIAAGGMSEVRLHREERTGPVTAMRTQQIGKR
jgi:hypothetical protein